MFRRIERKECVWKLTLLTQAGPLRPCVSPTAPPPHPELTTGVADLSWAGSVTFSDPELDLRYRVGVLWSQKLRILSVVKQPCTEKQIELVHREREEKRGGWRSRDKEPSGPERRY